MTQDSGFSLAPRSKPVVEKKGTSSIEELYDQFTKLVYLFDVSSSMLQPIDADPSVGDYEWDDGTMLFVRARLQEMYAEYRDAALSVTEPVSFEDYCADVFNLNPADDDGVRQWAVKQQFPLRPNLDANWDWKSKLEAVRSEAEKFVRHRFDLYPHSVVQIWAFARDAARLTKKAVTRDEVLEAIRNLSLSSVRHDGTRIFDAVSEVLGEIRKARASVGAHHIVLVSDGLDASAEDIVNLIPELKALGIVFDFIFMRTHEEERDYVRSITDRVSDALKKVCGETGGQYNEVSKQSDFGRRFFEASSRKCLPPAPKGGE